MPIGVSRGLIYLAYVHSQMSLNTDQSSCLIQLQGGGGGGGGGGGEGAVLTTRREAPCMSIHILRFSVRLIKIERPFL